MFEALKSKFGAITGAGSNQDLPQAKAPISLGESPFGQKGTPVGQITPQPRFQNMLKAVEPRVDATMAPAEQPIQEQQSSWRNLLDTHTQLVNPEDITSGLQQASDTVTQWTESPDQPIGAKIANYGMLGGIKALQGLDSSISQITKGTMGVLSGKGNIEDVGDIALGSLFAGLGVFAPGTTTAFSTASVLPGTKQILEGFSKLGAEQFQDISEYIPGFNQLSRQQRGTIFDIAKYTLAGYILHSAIPIKKGGTSLSPTEGAVDSAKAAEASKILNRKAGEDINKAFARKAKETHPDRAGGSTEAFQKVNEAYQYLKKEGFKETRANASPEQKSWFGQMIKKVADKVSKKYQGGVDLSTFKKTATGEPVPEPTNIKEYKDVAKGMLDQTVMTDQKMNEVQGNLAQSEVQNTHAQETYDTASKKVVQLSNDLGIDVEAEPNRALLEKKKAAALKDITLPNQKALVAKKYDDLIEAKKILEEAASAAGQDIGAGVDKAVATANQTVGKTDQTTKTQLEVMDDFLTNHTDIQDPAVEAKLRRVLDGEKVVDNGINYNKEVDKILQRNLDIHKTGVSGPSMDQAFGAISEQAKQPEKPVAITTPAAPTDAKVQRAVSDIVSQYRTYLKEGQTKGAKYAIGKIVGNKKAIQEARLKQPEIKDIAKIFSKYTPEIMEKALQIAKDKQAISPEQFNIAKEQLQRVLKNPENKLVNPTGGGLTDKQKVAILHWNNFNDIFKDTKTHKVNFTAVSESLKKNDLNLHIVSPGSAERLPIPFSLMGNKAGTAQNILAPLVKEGLQQGKSVYVEPFGGAGTSILMLPQYFRVNPDLQVHINIFDKEKYTLTDWARGKDDAQIFDLVNKNYNKIMSDVTKELMKSDRFRQTMDDVVRMYNELVPKEKQIDVNNIDKLLGSKEMGDITELVGFYPSLAKQYFKERLDGKVAIKGELTESFKDWLTDKITKEGQDKGLTEGQLASYIDENTKKVLSEDSKAFERQYPAMSRSISNIIDKYDVMKDELTPDEAMQVSIARQLRQRGTSGQRLLSAGEGFTNIEGIRTKLRYGLGRYRDVLDKFGDKVDIQNKDGGEFIKDMGAKYDGGKGVIRYDDPPYTQTTQTYKNTVTNETIKENLDNFANPEKLAKLFAPLKDAAAIMTNDVNGPYMTAMKGLYGDRMNPNVLGYREGTTPTSLMATNEFNTLPSSLELGYYTIRRNPKYTTMEESLKSEVLPKIAKGLEKPLVKMFQNFSLMDEKEAMKLVEAKEKMERGTIKKEEAEKLISTIMNDSEKRALINKFYTNLKRSSITGSDAVRLFKIIEGHMADRQAAIDSFKNTKAMINRKAEIDANAKEYLKGQLDQYTTENPTGEAQILAAKYNAGDPETIYAYESDKSVQDKIDSVAKTNINSLSNDEINNLVKDLKTAVDQGVDEYKLYKKQEKDYIENEIEKTRPMIRKEDFAKVTTDDIDRRPTQEEIIKNKITEKQKLMQQVMDDLYTPVRAATELGTINLKEKLVDAPLTERRDEKLMYQQQFQNKKFEIEKKYHKRFDKHDMEAIGKYLLLNKDRGTGIGPYIAYLKYKTPDISKEEIMKKIENTKAGKLLTPMQQELIPTIKDIFDKVGTQIGETFQKDQNKMFPKLQNYFPVIRNNQLVEKPPVAVKDNLSMLDALQQNYGASIAKGFTKEAKGATTVPLINAEVALLKHLNDGLYYAHMQEPLKQMTDIVNGLKEDLGTRGYKYMSEYIDRLKKQGSIHNDLSKFDRVVEKTLVGLRKGILMAKIPLAIMQMTDLVKAYGVTGEEPVTALRENISSKKVRDEIAKVSGHLRHREIDDPVYAEESWISGSLGRLGREIESYGMMPIAMTDRLATSTIFRTAYKSELAKKGQTPWTATPMEKREAGLKADTVTMKIASDPSFAGVSKAVLTNRGLKKLFTMFQNYALTQASQVRGTAVTEGVKSRRMARLILSIGVALVLEELIRQGYRKATNRSSTRSRSLDPFEKYTNNAAKTLMGQIPIAGNVADVFAGDTSLSTYASKLIQKKSYKDLDSFTRNVLFTLGRFAGLPVNPVEDFYTRLNPKKQKGSGNLNGGLGGGGLSSGL